MNLLELFAGSRTMSKVAKSNGYNVFSVDLENYEGIDLVMDIEYLEPSDIPFIPDVIWASPDCTTYTIAAISHHRNGIIPKSEYAIKCDNVNKHFIELIKYYLFVNPNLVFFIENPRGMMRKMPFMKQFDRATIYYCRYGDIRMKPTDIWTNHVRTIFNENAWNPRRKCWNNNKKCHHEPSPRGSKTGTQGLKDSYNRSVIPEQLCREILNSIPINPIINRIVSYTGTTTVCDP